MAAGTRAGKWVLGLPAACDFPTAGNVGLAGGILVGGEDAGGFDGRAGGRVGPAENAEDERAAAAVLLEGGDAPRADGLAAWVLAAERGCKIRHRKGGSEVDSAFRRRGVRPRLLRRIQRRTSAAVQCRVLIGVGPAVPVANGHEDPSDIPLPAGISPAR